MQTIDKRFELLKNYLRSIWIDFKIEVASDDASFRRYFRVYVQNTTYIVMDAPPKKEPLDDFIAIAKLFKNNAINTPKIHFENKELGFLIIDDFGDTTLLKNPTLEYYKLAIDEIITLQRIQNSNLPTYSPKILQNEMNLAQQWYNKDFDYTDIFAYILNNITTHKQVVVHRDYHSRNIMLTDNNLGIIDFQDAIIGSYVYDIASLLKDAYIDLGDITQLQKYFFKESNLEDFDQFIFDFDMIATQRHIKILGIFKRLSIRDGKNSYLKDLPLIEKYLITISEKYPELNNLKELCKQ